MENQGVTTQINSSDKTMIPQPQGEATIIGTPINCPVCSTENAPTETYCGECGFLLSATPGEAIDIENPAEQTRLIEKDGREHHLKEGENLAGRENADILLGDPTVSRRHALFTLEDGRLWVEDLGSTNGTYIESRRIDTGERLELKDSEEITLGSVVLTIKLPVVTAEEPESEAPDIEEPAESADETSTEAVVCEEPSVEAEPSEEAVEQEEEESPVGKLVYSEDPSRSFPVIEGCNTIGRRTTNDIVIADDQYVSGVHAQIVADQLGIWLVDVGSTNGTLLNGTRIESDTRMALGGGEEIVIGRTNLRFELS